MAPSSNWWWSIGSKAIRETYRPTDIQTAWISCDAFLLLSFIGCVYTARAFLKIDFLFVFLNSSFVIKTYDAEHWFTWKCCLPAWRSQHYSCDRRIDTDDSDDWWCWYRRPDATVARLPVWHSTRDSTAKYLRLPACHSTRLHGCVSVTASQALDAWVHGCVSPAANLAFEACFHG